MQPSISKQAGACYLKSLKLSGVLFARTIRTRAGRESGAGDGWGYDDNAVLVRGRADAVKCELLRGLVKNQNSRNCTRNGSPDVADRKTCQPSAAPTPVDNSSSRK